MSAQRRKELHFQNLVMNSYRRQGGEAKKWASGWQTGNPDLICALPFVGMHLLELKHRPELGVTRDHIPNPLTKKQQHEAKVWVKAGGLALGGVIGKSDRALGSVLYVFPPNAQVVNATLSLQSPYEAGVGYDMEGLLLKIRTFISGQQTNEVDQS